MTSPSIAPQNEKTVDGFTVAEITPQQKRKWDDTLSMMQWVAPGFVHLQYRLLNAQTALGSDHVALFSRDVPIAATDGVNLILNPDTYFEFKLAQRVYIDGHEILHEMFNDVALLHWCTEKGYVLMPDGSKIPFDEPTFQRAADARINAILDESNIGERPKDKDGKEIGIHDPQVKATDSFFDIYKRYYKKPPEGGQPGQPGKPGQPGQGFDKILKPGQSGGKSPDQALNGRNPQQWAVELAQAQKLEKDNKANAKGDLPAGLDLLFRNLLEPEISWIDKIETLVKRQFGDGAVEWTEPHPWFGAFDFFVPADTGMGAGWIVMWGDSSGSHMADSIIQKCVSEMAGLMEQVRPTRLTLIWGDAAVQRVEEIADPDDLRRTKPKGGGGTNYQPVLDWIAKNSRGSVPDLFMGFTDGYVDHPKKAPPYPVIWASTTDSKYPFGTVVRVNNVRKAA